MISCCRFLCIIRNRDLILQTPNFRSSFLGGLDLALVVSGLCKPPLPLPFPITTPPNPHSQTKHTNTPPPQRFTMYGICGCFIQFLVFPPTARYFGVLKCFKACAVTFPFICFLTPYTALIQDSTHQQAAMFSIMVVKCFTVIFAFPCSIILLTNSAVSLRVLGTLNGVAVSISAVGRAVGPALGGEFSSSSLYLCFCCVLRAGC